MVHVSKLRERVEKRASTSLYMILALSSGPLYAQTPPSALDQSQSSSGSVQNSASDRAAPASSSNAVGDIIVTAQRREQRLIDVPISIQAQTGAQLAKAGVVDGRGLEQVSPAVNFESGYSAQTTSLSIRGVVSVGQEGGIQPSVGVVVDDMPLARQGEVTLELADIDRVEVLSGPQGTLFGKNSTAGVVNIVTKRPTHQYDLGFELTGTSDKQALAKGYVNIPLNSIFALRLNGYYDYLDPKIQNIAGPDEFGRRAYGGQGKLLVDLGQTSFVLTGVYNHDYNTLSVQLPTQPIPGLAAQQRAINPFIYPGATSVAQNTPSFNLSKQYAIIGELNSQLADHVKLTSISGYRSYQYIDDTDIDVGPTGGGVGLGLQPNPTGYPISYYSAAPNHERGAYRYFSQEVRLAYSSSRLDALIGAYYQHYRESRSLQNGFIFDGAFATGVPALAGVDFYNLTQYTSYLRDDTAAAFGDLTYSIIDKIKLFGGLRYTYEKLGLDYDRNSFFNPVTGFFNPVTGINTAPAIAQLQFSGADTTDHNLSGRAGVQWQPARNSNFYGSYSRGYKGPAANQGASVSGPETALLKPEIASAFEVGAKQRFFNGALDIDVALYHQIIENIQQTSVRPGTVVVDLINAGALKTDGFEFNANARPLTGLVLTTGVVYNHARYSGNVFFSCGPTAVGNGTCQNDPAPGLESLNGKRAVASPEWKVVSTADYVYDIPGPLKLDFNASFNYRGSVQYQLYEDPITLAGGRSIIDASVGVLADNDKWQLTVFVKNLTNKFYYSNLNTVSIIGLQYGNLPRDFARYGGLRLSYRM